MRSRKVVILALVMAFTLALPGSSHAGFFSKLFKSLTLSGRILLGWVRNKDVPSIVNRVQGMYTFPQVEGLQTFKAEMLEMPSKQALEFQKQKTVVKYKTSSDGGECKMEIVNAGTVSKDTQKAVFQGTNLPSAGEFGKVLFPPSLDQEKAAYPNLSKRSKPMFLFSFFCNDLELNYAPQSGPKSYHASIDSAKSSGDSANNALGLAGDNVGQANGALGGFQQGLQGLSSQLGGIGGSSNPLSGLMSFIQNASGLLTKFKDGAGGIQGLLNNALGQITQAQNEINRARNLIQDGKGKIKDISDQLGQVGGGAAGAAQKLQAALAKLDEAGAKADELLGVVNGFADQIQGLGSEVNSMLTEMIGKATGMQGQLSSLMGIMNSIMSLISGGSEGAMGMIQSMMSGIGSAGGTLGSLTSLVSQFSGAGAAGMDQQYGDTKKSYVITPAFTIKAIRSATSGGGGAWAYVFSKFASSQGATKMVMYTWLGVKYYYFPFPESITVRGTKNVAGFPVIRHLLNVNWDATDFPPLKVKLIFFRNQQVNIPLNMSDQQAEDEVVVDDPAALEEHREDTYKELKDAAQAVADQLMASGHVLAASRIAALTAASSAWQTVADTVDHMEEIVKNTTISENASGDAGRVSEQHMADAANGARSAIKQIIDAIPVKTENGKTVVGKIDPNQLKNILKSLCGPTRKAAAGSARVLEALAATTDAQGTKRFSEIKFNYVREWALRAEALAAFTLATSDAKAALRASKIAQAFDAQGKKDSGQISQFASVSSEEARRAVAALDAATAGSGKLRPNLSLEQRVFQAAEDAKTDQSFESKGSENDDSQVEVYGDYDPYDHDNTDGSDANSQRGPFSQQAHDLMATALASANEIADKLSIPGNDFVSDNSPNTDVLKEKYKQVADVINKLNSIRQLEARAARQQRLSVQRASSRLAAVRGLIGAYAGMADPAKQKAKDLMLQAASIGDDPNVITEEWTSPGMWANGDPSLSNVKLNKLSVQQLSQVVAAQQAKATVLANRAKQLNQIATKKESIAFQLENSFLKKLLGAIIRRSARAHAYAGRAHAIATTLCGASAGEKSDADNAASEGESLANLAEQAERELNQALNAADSAESSAHRARIEALIAIVDAQMADEELSRFTDALKNKVKQGGGGDAAGDGDGQGGKTTKDIIAQIQSAMDDGDLPRLIELLKKIISQRGTGDPLGRLAQAILDILISDANRAIEEARETTHSGDINIIFNGRDIADLISTLLGGTGADDSAKDLRDLGLGDVGGSGKGGGRFDSLERIKLNKSGTGSGTDTGNGGVANTTGTGFKPHGFSFGGGIFGKGGGGSGSGLPAVSDKELEKQAEQLFQIAQQKEQDGQVSEAVKLYQTIVDEFPKSTFVDPSKERLRALLGNPENKKSIDDGAAVFLARGKALVEKNDEKGAINMFNVVIDDFPTSTQRPEAEELKKQILQHGLPVASLGTAGGETQGFVPNGWTRDPSGDGDAAAQMFQDAQTSDKEGAFQDAIKNYAAIIDQYPDSGYAKPSKERLDALMGDSKVKQAIEDEAAVLMSRGAGMMESGNVAGALQMYNTVISDYPTSRYTKEAKEKINGIEAQLQGTGK